MPRDAELRVLLYPLSPNNQMDQERAALMRVLYQHGFDIAAKALSDKNCREQIHYRRVIASWTNYPQCMARHPKYIRKQQSQGKPAG